MHAKWTGMVAGMAASAVGVGGAQAQENGGRSLELAVSVAEIDLASASYGYNFTEDAPLVSHDESDTGARFDARWSAFDGDLLGVPGGLYLRASYQDVSGSFASTYAKDPGDTIVVPTGIVGFDEFQSLAITGSGNIVSRRAVDQTEADLAVGFAFDHAINGFTPHIEVALRRAEVEHTITADRVGVTPVLEEFSTDNSALESTCADATLGLQRTFALTESWTFIADASASAAFCSHDLDRSFSFESSGNSYDNQNADESDEANIRGALSGRFVRRLSDGVNLSLIAYARGESDAPYVAYPTLTFDNNNLPVVTGTVRIDTESRASYGAGISLAFSLD